MEINISNFPIINVVFPEKMDDRSMNQLLTTWKRLYQEQKYFKFIFDTKKLSSVGFTYCFQMAKFMYELKQEKTQYLEESMIIVDNPMIHRLLDFVFLIQKPVSKVRIVNDDFELLSEL